MKPSKRTARELTRVQDLTSRVSARLFGTVFKVQVLIDKKFGRRIYLRVSYLARCTKGEIAKLYFGRKWYLSSHMLDDEIIKTAYTAFKMAVEHEILEGFKVDDKVLFNPHINFEELLKISHKEVEREKPKKAKGKAKKPRIRGGQKGTIKAFENNPHHS